MYSAECIGMQCSSPVKEFLNNFLYVKSALDVSNSRFIANY